MSMFLFHILFIIPFMFIYNKNTYRLLLIIGAVFPDLVSVPFYFSNYMVVHNFFTILGLSILVGIVASRFTKEISGFAIAMLLYGGSLNHLLVDFVTHPYFSPFYPFQYSIMDGFMNPISYWGILEWDTITIIISFLLTLSVVCLLLAKRYYSKSDTIFTAQKFKEPITER